MTGGTYTPPQGRILGFLTDGTGVSSITLVKFFKDFIADVLLSAAAALVAVQIITVDAAVAAPQVAAFAILGAVIRAGYRAVLRWATTE
jgi:hypothetical protein